MCPSQGYVWASLSPKPTSQFAFEAFTTVWQRYPILAEEWYALRNTEKEKLSAKSHEDLDEEAGKALLGEDKLTTRSYVSGNPTD